MARPLPGKKAPRPPRCHRGGWGLVLAVIATAQLTVASVQRSQDSPARVY